MHKFILVLILVFVVVVVVIGCDNNSTDSVTTPIPTQTTQGGTVTPMQTQISVLTPQASPTKSSLLYTPCNPSPADGAVNVSVHVVLSWESENPAGDNVLYRLYLGKITPMMKTTWESATRYQPYVDSLEYGESYVWKIEAKDSRGGITSGPVWHFTVEDNPDITPTFVPTPTLNN